jgi:hypothetical protein
VSGSVERDAVERWLHHVRRDEGGRDDLDLVIYLPEERDVFFEARTADATFAAALQLDAGGAVARSLLLDSPLLPAPPPWEGHARPPVQPLLERYFEALGAADFESAAACFSEDCLYAHPPYRPGDPPAQFHGRRELLELWPSRRGTRRFETRIERCVQRGNHAFVEGVSAGGSFLSSIVLDRDGLIARYVAFYTAQLVPRLPDRTDRG